MRRRREPGTGDPVLVAAIAELAGAAVVTDRALDIVAITPPAQPVVGDAVGKNFVKVLCGRDVDAGLVEALRRERAISALIRCDDGKRWFDVRATPIGPPGAPAGWIVMLRPAADRDPEVISFHGLVTRDPAMARLFEVIERVAGSDARVLVRGETGSGKELVARAVHALSPRHAGPFRAINCAALPGSLLESELFGHVRGAFTGAVRDNPGHFRLASGGTLFLDEVGEMPLELQAKLLRVVETGTVIPVGGSEPVAVDVRIIGATHRSLRAETAAGRFRADLMYRLRVVPVFLPPLRARRRDIPLLAGRFLAELSARGPRTVGHIAPGALEILEHWSWPGNVRELQNAIEYAYVTGEGPVLLASDLPPELSGEEPPLDGATTPEDEERHRILSVLDRVKGSRERAAQLLGMSRSTLWRRLKALGID